MKKIIIPLLSVFTLILVILATVFLTQAIVNKDVEAEGVVSYNETWTATAGTYAGSWSQWGTLYYSHMNGIPGDKTSCAYALQYSTYGTAVAIDCSATITQWSVTGTINSGTSGVKRYFITNNYAYYGYDHPTYGNLQTLTSSFCNSDSNNPGGYFHVHLDGPYTNFASNGVTVRGDYGTGIAGQDNYIQTSLSTWFSKNGQYGYLENGKVLAGMSLLGTDTNIYAMNKILCVED